MTELYTEYILYTELYTEKNRIVIYYTMLRWFCKHLPAFCLFANINTKQIHCNKKNDSVKKSHENFLSRIQIKCKGSV